MKKVVLAVAVTVTTLSFNAFASCVSSDQSKVTITEMSYMTDNELQSSICLNAKYIEVNKNAAIEANKKRIIGPFVDSVLKSWGTCADEVDKKC